MSKTHFIYYAKSPGASALMSKIWANRTGTAHQSPPAITLFQTIFFGFRCTLVLFLRYVTLSALIIPTHQLNCTRVLLRFYLIKLSASEIVVV